MQPSRPRWLFRWLIIGVAVSLQAGLLGNASAQAKYPDRPIRLIVPAPPGGATDTMGRVVAQYLGEKLGVSVVVDNKGGATGIIGTEAAARADADGYTLLFTSGDTATILPLLRDNLPYDPEHDFVPVAKVADSYLLLTSNLNFPAKSVRELVRLAKEKPGHYTFGTGGAGTITHLMIEMLQQQAGIELQHIPYKGGGPALAGAIGGSVQLLGSGMSVAKSVEAGQLRGLAVTRATRSPQFPSVPTMVENGYPEFVASAWFGILAPAGVSEQVVKTVSDAVLEMGGAPDFEQRILTVGGEVNLMGSKDFAESLKNETKLWGEVISNRQIKLESY